MDAVFCCAYSWFMASAQYEWESMSSQEDSAAEGQPSDSVALTEGGGDARVTAAAPALCRWVFKGIEWKAAVTLIGRENPAWKDAAQAHADDDQRRCQRRQGQDRRC